MKLEEQVFSYIEKYNMIETGSHVIAGVSGGADSVCLLFLLREYRKKKSFQLRAVHVNHGIRGEEAKRDENFTRELCGSLGIPLSVYAYDVPRMAAEQKLSMEEAGRAARSQAFFQEGRKLLALEQEIPEDSREAKKICIALAHHENDNAETMVHNLIRGTGAAGLGGIRPIQIMEEEVYIRPLLGVSRKEIQGYLKERGISWVEDSSNQQPVYTRNYIRSRILPLMEEINPGVVRHMGETAETFRQIEEYLQEKTDMLYKEYVKQQEGRWIISQKLLKEKEILQSYVVKRVLELAAGGKKDISARHVESARQLLSGRTGACVSLGRGIKARQVYGNVEIGSFREEPEGLKELEFRIFPYENQQIPEKTYTKWFDYDKIERGLEVRHRLPGDFLTVNQTGGRKKLKDYFIDCKIPREVRDDLTLLAEGSHVLWVVGGRISEYYKITSQTKQILEVHVKGVKEDE